MKSIKDNIRKLSALLLSALIIAVCLSACSPFKADANLTHLLDGIVASLDPQTAKNEAEFTVINSIFEGLCRIDESGETVPGVAESWQANADSTVFEFILRGDAKWSEGQPVTAHDFVFGLQRALDPATKATAIDELFIIKNALAVNSGEISPESLGVSAKDERTLVIELERSYADFPALTAEARFMPCNEEFFHSTEGYYGLDCVYTLANGPFTFATNYSWEKEKYIDLARTNNYRGEHSVAPAGIRMLMEDAEGYREDPLTAMLNGDIELLPIEEENIADMESAGCGIKALNDLVCGLIINPAATAMLDEYSGIPLENTSLRAIYMRSIERDILLSRLPSTITEATSIMPQSIMWNDAPYTSNTYPEYDPNLKGSIENLLSSVGLDRIPSITIICPDNELSQSLVNAIITSWNNQLGNSFNLEPLDSDAFYRRIASGDYQAALYTMNSHGTQPASVLKQFSSTSTPTLLNSPDFDAQLKASMFDVDVYWTLENLIREACVFYPIYYDEEYFVTSPETENIRLLPNGIIDFSQTRKKDCYGGFFMLTYRRFPEG